MQASHWDAIKVPTADWALQRYLQQLGHRSSLNVYWWTDEEDVAYIHNGILDSKEQDWVIYREVDGPRVCQSEVKSEREKQVLCISTHIWNLQKLYWWAYLQGRKKDADVENGPVDTVRKKKVGQMNRVALTYIHYCEQNGQLAGSCCAARGAQPAAATT